MNDDPVTLARILLRECLRASLATTLEDGAPYASLVLVAAAEDGAPLLLLSDLAQHTLNLSRDPRAALLFDGTAGVKDPLDGARLTLLGEVERWDNEADRFLERHPSARTYVGFKDFHFYRMIPTRAHLVAGFGRIHWLEGSALLGNG
ncbi:MAG TPA: pyridoxamine 5'-phosphate oxidase family protein [Stellaceae bacterium]|nr:pyridoxamine 5'-phosphate oxidase family protein [Stellaceae bacterium]